MLEAERPLEVKMMARGKMCVCVCGRGVCPILQWEEKVMQDRDLVATGEAMKWARSWGRGGGREDLKPPRFQAVKI